MSEPIILKMKGSSTTALYAATTTTRNGSRNQGLIKVNMRMNEKIVLIIYFAVNVTVLNCSNGP